jgi:hypothetical protein
LPDSRAARRTADRNRSDVVAVAAAFQYRPARVDTVISAAARPRALAGHGVARSALICVVFAVPIRSARVRSLTHDRPA